MNNTSTLLVEKNLQQATYVPVGYLNWKLMLPNESWHNMKDAVYKVLETVLSKDQSSEVCIKISNESRIYSLPKEELWKGAGWIMANLYTICGCGSKHSSFPDHHMYYCDRYKISVNPNYLQSR